VSFGVAVITPRWLYVLAAATGTEWGDPVIVDESLDPIDTSTIQAGDVVGIGIHTGNARRGYEVGRLARERGAWVVYGGIHATLFPEEAHEHGAAHAVVKGGPTEEDLRRRPRRRRRICFCPLGLIARSALHVGIRANRARLSEALLVLLGLAH
jgi:hypothetical protein